MDSSGAVALNPSSPDSVGALLAEEWTIDPYSTLPSFVENVMMSEASRSTHHFVGTTISAAEHALRQRVLMDPPSLHEAIGGEEDTSPSPFRLRHISKLYRALLALRRKVLASSLSLVSQYKLELQYLLVLLTEGCSLALTDAMVGEALYGAKRVKLGGVHPANGTGNETGQSSPVKRSLAPLSRSGRTCLALWISLIPYLREKNERLVRKQHFVPSPANVVSPRRRLQTHILPALHIFLALADLLCRWRYLMGRSIHFDLASLALQQVVRRVTQQDTMAPSGTSSSVTSDRGQGPFSVDRDDKAEANRLVLNKGAQVARQSLIYMIVGALAVSWLTQIRHEFLATGARVREQQRREIENRQNSATALLDESSGPDEPPREDRPPTFPWLSESGRVPPPPPAPSLPNEDSIPIGGCPLCRQSSRRKPTASSSGYVFCFACILDYVKQHHRCPVTGARCQDSDLVRLYEPEPKPQPAIDD
jgi:peroxin-12